MTACVKNHSKRVALAISASLVGALTLGAAPVAAMAADGVETLAENPAPVWQGVDFTWNVEADPVNGYVIELGDQFLLSSATDPFGTPISMSDLTVLYFKDGGNGAVGADGKFGEYDGISTSAPEDAGTYYAVVINGRNIPTGSINGYTPFMTQIDGKYDYEVVEFTVEAKSLEGSFAYEADDVNDTSFKFTGIKKEINFADADGNKLVEGEDYDIVAVRDDKGTAIPSGINGVIGAETYIVSIKGTDGGAYEGSTATVTFEVDPIDFENDTFTVKTVKADAASPLFNGTDGTLLDPTIIMVNGEPVAEQVLTAKAVSVDRVDGEPANPSAYIGNVPAKVVLSVSADSSKFSTDNFLGDPTTVEMKVVDKLVENFYYDNEQLGDSSTPADGVFDLAIDASKGESFDPALITAALEKGGKSLPVDVTVYRDGEVTDDYSTPGTLTVSVDVITPNDLSYGGSASLEVTIKGKHYGAEPKAFATVDGKDAKGAEVEYDAEAVEPVVVAKSGSATIDAADYTVTYTDADGEAVEEIVEPGEYTGTVDFGNATWGINGASNDVDKVTFTFTVTKAQLRSAKADKDVYAYTGDAVTPVFIAYNEDDLEGLSIEIDPAVTGVSYLELEVDKETGKPVEYTDGATGTGWIDVDEDGVADYKLKSGNIIKASELSDEGYYVAEVTAPADDPHFAGQAYSVPFQISEYAAFSDVDASAWYADAVYNAADLGYMTGISDTDLFMPMADITRAELAKVFGNMAGEAFSPIYTPTKFDDVDPLAWYAGAVAWADEAGIVTGYDDTTFGPSDKATREQVAVMLYRYAAGQGKDVTVDDVEGTLAAYKDGDQVSDWARTAMAWAVENGVFGQGTDELWAKQNIQRAAVATIAVRFQPEALPEA